MTQGCSFKIALGIRFVLTYVSGRGRGSNLNKGVLAPNLIALTLTVLELKELTFTYINFHKSYSYCSTYYFTDRPHAVKFCSIYLIWSCIRPN